MCHIFSTGLAILQLSFRGWRRGTWEGRAEGSCPFCTVSVMAASAESCAYCGKQGAGFKRCSRCKQASYCGASCQNAHWKRHKKKCAPPLSLRDVAENIRRAHNELDWRGVLKWEGRMEELVACSPSDEDCWRVMSAFCDAHRMQWQATGSEDHARSYAGLQERRIPLLGKLQRFWDQGKAMCDISNVFDVLKRYSEATTWCQRARDVGAAHGFFSLESTACRGLGLLAMEAGRQEEGVELLRNALVAADLSELDNPAIELDALQALIPELFKIKAIDEVEPLVVRYREATKAQSERGGMYLLLELRSIVLSARLHEVLSLCTPRFGPPFAFFGACFQHGRIASVCHRFCHGRGRHMHLLNLPLSGTRQCASAPCVENTTTLHGPCFQHGGRLSACHTLFTPERRHVHLLNLPSSVGTREASRGREGGARSARPDARK